MVQRDGMPSFRVVTDSQQYECLVERGISARAASYIPPKAGRVFIVTTEEVWRLHGERVTRDLPKEAEVLFYPDGESNKRLSVVEALADELLERKADRASLLIGLGGGIVTDVCGFMAAIYMRGIPVLQIPTTLLAQVDAAIGGKTGVNLAGGKNLVGSFHQPLAVLIDPDVLSTLPPREFRAGLYEVIKCGIIRDPSLFHLLAEQSDDVLAQHPSLLEQLIAGAVKVKCEVVSADEREGGLRRILNFGHTVGHALEAETGYRRFLHGEAVAWGMLAATRLALLVGELPPADHQKIEKVITQYGALPQANDLDTSNLIARLSSDKKTLAGTVHFVLPTAVGATRIMSGIDERTIRQAMLESFSPER